MLGFHDSQHQGRIGTQMVRLHALNQEMPPSHQRQFSTLSGPLRSTSGDDMAVVSSSSNLHSWRLSLASRSIAFGLVHVVLDEERLLNRRLRARHVLADRRLRVGLGTRIGWSCASLYLSSLPPQIFM